jgi:hypothetical protein
MHSHGYSWLWSNVSVAGLATAVAWPQQDARTLAQPPQTPAWPQVSLMAAATPITQDRSGVSGVTHPTSMATLGSTKQAHTAVSARASGHSGCVRWIGHGGNAQPKLR